MAITLRPARAVPVGSRCANEMPCSAAATARAACDAVASAACQGAMSIAESCRAAAGGGGCATPRASAAKTSTPGSALQ